MLSPDELSKKLSRLQTSPTAVSVADVRQDDMPLIFVNDAFCRMTGYSEEEVIGKNCRFLQGPDTQEAHVNEIRRSIHSTSHTLMCLTNHTKSGDAFHNCLMLSPIIFDGELAYILGCQYRLMKHVDAEQLWEHANGLRTVGENIHSSLSDYMDDTLIKCIRARSEAIHLIVESFLLREKSNRALR